MNASEIRQKYLDFMKSKGHVVIEPAPLVLENDPTTLFTGSGMQPLLPYLLGQPHKDGKRLTDSQPCLRLQDIDDVGDPRHTTVFEMLGNWSLGDYFKEEQIRNFFTFLTQEVGLDPQKIYVTCFIGNEEYGIPKTKPIVLYVGRVDPEKSLDILMDAFIKAHKKVPDAHLVVVGDGTARPKLEAQIEKAGLSANAHFLGRVIGDNLPQLYRTGTVFAITSKTETQSIVLMEAMASGLPCVAVNAGAIHELVKDNKNGYLCEADDVDAVANGLVKILSDKDRQAKMSDESVKRAAKHDISHTLTRLEEIYNTVLDNREKEL